MKPKTVSIDLDLEQAQALAEAVRAYAQAAFPPGGSECAQVSRNTLLDTAEQCAVHAGGTLALRRRQLPLLRAAVRWMLSEDGPGGVESARDLESLLN